MVKFNEWNECGDEKKVRDGARMSTLIKGQDFEITGHVLLIRGNLHIKMNVIILIRNFPNTFVSHR